jgi:hypothetical protein
MSLLKTLKVKTQDKIKEQFLPIIASLVILIGAYTGSLFIPANWFTYLLSLPACVIILITALARLNDIKPAQSSARWHVRRAGLMLAGVAAMSFMTTPWTSPPLFPSWKAVMLMYGLALAWLTTPNMPPWWKYITGEFKSKGDVV